MMIQRDAQVKLWGWADRGETVTVSLNGQTNNVKPDKDGIWRVTLNAVPAGGPYEMTISGSTNTVTVKNILSGDIWVCSGQSNMEMSVAGTRGKVNNWQKEIEEATYPQIRLLTVKKKISPAPLKDIETQGWTECNPQSIGDFSATAYFFGREIHKQTGVPVGLINTSWGGTNIETWTSLPTMKTIPEYLPKINRMTEKKQPASLPVVKVDEITVNDLGFRQQWYKSGYKIKGLKQVSVPSTNQDEGIFWYRMEFELDASQAAAPITLNLGKIDDNDITFLNGVEIGRTEGHDIERVYTVNKGLKQGKNELVVCLINPVGSGGIYSDADQIFCKTASGNIPLAGKWYCTKSAILKRNSGPNEYPSLLYNAMIVPLAEYPIKGFIWYQGEANANKAYLYRTLFANMINDWRKVWKQNDLPFYFVQLANFMKPSETPTESNWAELREAQHLALKLPNTGEAVTVDIGDADDIHPKNKQDVGYRLALNALAKTYGKDIEYAGPEYASMKVEGDKIVLTFKHAAKGLVAGNKYGYLNGFTIAGDDRKFVWAQAYIDGNTVVVHSNKVKTPVAVRYAWANNPDDVNFYNSEGLPASPFRSDSWEISTQNN
jgi:sialate O-acetylesterase